MPTTRTTSHSVPTPTERTGFGLHFERLTPVHWAGMGLSAVTGVVHLYLYYQQEYLPFLLAGVVFLAAVAGVALNVYPRVLYALGIPFTAGQIGIWVMQGMPEMQIAMIDKPVQALLIVALAYLLWAESR